MMTEKTGITLELDEARQTIEACVNTALVAEAVTQKEIDDVLESPVIMSGESTLEEQDATLFIAYAAALLSYESFVNAGQVIADILASAEGEIAQLTVQAIASKRLSELNQFVLEMSEHGYLVRQSAVTLREEIEVYIVEINESTSGFILAKTDLIKVH